MIYVISSPAFKSDGGFEKLLKIGYTEDSKKDRRYYQYKAHNPTIKVLYEIPNGTLELENLIHSYFNKYKYGDFGKEWFIWDEEIIKFFEINKTVEDLLSILDPSLLKRSPKKRFNGFNKFSYKIIDYCLNLKMRLDNSLDLDQIMKLRESCYKDLDKSNLVLKEGVTKFIVNYFDLTLDQYTEFMNIKLPENILGFVEDFNNLPGFYDKMKAICESDFSENERMMILEQVPILYKNLYLQVGPDRLKANSYNITFIKKELKDYENNNNIDVKSEILKSFQLGHRYSLAEIKLILGNIYKNINYISTPKASDLANYFELRPVKFFDNIQNKTVHGYEILKKK